MKGACGISQTRPSLHLLRIPHPLIHVRTHLFPKAEVADLLPPTPSASPINSSQHLVDGSMEGGGRLLEAPCTPSVCQPDQCSIAPPPPTVSKVFIAQNEFGLLCACPLCHFPCTPPPPLVPSTHTLLHNRTPFGGMPPQDPQNTTKCMKRGTTNRQSCSLFDPSHPVPHPPIRQTGR